MDPAYSQLSQERHRLENLIATERLSFGEATGHLARLENQLAALIAYGKSMFHREAAKRQDHSEKRRVILDQLSDHLRNHLDAIEQPTIAWPPRTWLPPRTVVQRQMETATVAAVPPR